MDLLASTVPLDWLGSFYSFPIATPADPAVFLPTVTTQYRAKSVIVGSTCASVTEGYTKWFAGATRSPRFPGRS